MANEIQVTVTELKDQVDATKKVTVVFDVWHNADSVYIAQAEEMRGPTDQNELKNRVEERARQLYAEYEEQKIWFEYTLPKSWNIDEA